MHMFAVKACARTQLETVIQGGRILCKKLVTKHIPHSKIIFLDVLHNNEIVSSEEIMRAMVSYLGVITSHVSESSVPNVMCNAELEPCIEG